MLETACGDIAPDTTNISVHFKVAGVKDFKFDLRGQMADKSPQQQKEQMEAERLRMARTILRVKDSHRIPYKALQALRSKAGIDSVPPENVLQRESLRLATCLELVAIDKVSSL